MNQQIKQQWVEALRSGTYRQCLSELRNQSDDYCVNGVLCDLHAQATGQAWVQIGLRHAWFYLQAHCFPVREVREWAEIDEETLNVLEQMNDSRYNSKTFAELADYIEANL